MVKKEDFNPNRGERLGPAWRAMQDLVDQTTNDRRAKMVPWVEIIEAMQAVSPKMASSTYTALIYRAKYMGLIQYNAVRPGVRVVWATGVAWPPREGR